MGRALNRTLIFKHTDGFSRSTDRVNWTYNFRADSSFTVVSPWA